MNDEPARILRRSLLLAGGSTDHSIAASRRDEQWQGIRRGAWLAGSANLSAEERSRALIAATAPLLANRSVLSHESAAVWWGLPLVGWLPRRVHVVRQDPHGGFRRGQLHCHVGVLGDDEIELFDGLLLTSVARTIVDCARTLPFDTGLVLADAALHAGLTTPAELGQQVRLASRKTGVGRARQVVAFGDERSESPGESLSRIRIADHGIPAPELQYEVRTDSGLLVAQCDFWWKESRTIGEFDGKVKYGRYLRPGESPGDAAYREKVREDRIRDEQHQVVRWGWDETLSTEAFAPVAKRLRRAFGRGLRNTKATTS